MADSPTAAGEIGRGRRGYPELELELGRGMVGRARARRVALT